MSAVELDFRILPMSFGDVPAVVRNERLSYSHPWTEGIFQDCLQSGNECWLIKRQQKVLGHGILSVAAGESHLLNVCVAPDYQGEGFGRLLVEHLVKCARAKGAGRTILEVRPSNPVAIALYHSMGFTEIGRRRGYYPGTEGREDALVLTLDWSQGT
ncbi:MAG: ribosomal protein S18-alanine N-acetyltransferase [Pseudomonadales bacterium]|jgi:ribosomal-protein-alanine N-acetyltransferase